MRQQSGFSLLEVMVAFSILSILLVGVLQSRADMTHILFQTAKNRKIENYIHLKLLEIERNASEEKVTLQQGRLDDFPELKEARWEKVVTDEDYFNVSIRKVVFRILWKEKDQVRQYEKFILIGQGS
ncbi:MAG: prepilin-type N-terminal cleavage/methylation domain-containing protein [bacterium]|jgi:prepilin-type N-terminal cleavage/methylation domain-containing protein